MRIAFIGTRSEVVSQIIKMRLELVKAYVVSDSRAHQICQEQNIHFWELSKENKQEVWEDLKALDFDILISNGCPYILPVSFIKGQSDKLFINVHPSFLPYYKGLHPINGVLLNAESYTGATMHFMDDDLDTGAIIHQDKIVLTPDISLNLLYDLNFYLEGKVFETGIKKILKDRAYKGVEQSNVDSHYSRLKKDQIVDLENDDTVTILNKIRAFSNGHSGPKIKTNFGLLQLISAYEITHPVALEYLEMEAPRLGTIVKAYNQQFILKSKDGYVFISNYKSDFSIREKMCLIE
jgi:methionyl-tRNA formyltransferase